MSKWLTIKNLWTQSERTLWRPKKLKVTRTSKFKFEFICYVSGEEEGYSDDEPAQQRGNNQITTQENMISGGGGRFEGADELDDQYEDDMYD